VQVVCRAPLGSATKRRGGFIGGNPECKILFNFWCAKFVLLILPYLKYIWMEANNGVTLGGDDGKEEDSVADASDNDSEGSSEEEDLDKFWNMVETKLRAPFSSFELCKTVEHLPTEKSKYKFIKALQSTFPRMAKPVKLRLLVSFLGMDRSGKLDKCIHGMLSDIMRSKEDDWVRNLSLLLYKKIYKSNDEIIPSDTVLKKTTEDICKQIVKHIEALADQEVDEQDSSGDEIDKKGNKIRDYMYEDGAPQYLPFKYSLVETNLLKKILPACDDALHFTVNEDASILKVDAQNEAKKIEEERKEMDLQSRAEASVAARKNVTTKSNSNASSKNRSSSSSMFIPSRNPLSGKGRANPMFSRIGGRGRALKAGGRATARLSSKMTSNICSSSTSNTQKQMGRALKQVKSSKMKIIDTNEAADLAKSQREQEVKDSKLSARKRKILEAAKASGLHSKKKKYLMKEDAVVAQKPHVMKVNVPEKTPVPQKEVVASVPSQQTSTGDGISSSVPPPITENHNTNWKQLLDGSNKLSQEDRIRIEQFFTTKYNPTPDVQLYQIKLHDEKKMLEDQKTVVKETWYLELDYRNMKSRKFRKTKKY